jgi:two-component system cell cycle sensor histidine kinase/response regulator CckA
MSSEPENEGRQGVLPRGSETILIVEDEAPLRTMVRIVLTRLGYHVHEAESGVEALRMWGEIGKSVDLLFTDMVMPNGLSGHQLAKELQQQSPTLRVLFTSGYSPQMLTQTGRLPQGASCLQKPYLPPALASAVRNALNQAPVAVAA